MWVGLWMAFSVSATVSSQQTNNRLQQAGAGYEWGWLTPGTGQGTVGQYFVKLPQSEQRVVYSADSSGYHGAVAVNTSDGHHTHTHTFALGQKAIELNAQQEKSSQNQLNPNQKNTHLPVDIYLLNQLSPQYVNHPNYYHLIPNYNNNLTPLYNINTEHPKAESSKPLEKEAKFEQVISPVQIFKHHNCTEEEDKELKNDLKKSQDLFAEVSSYNNWKDINGNFGVKTKKTQEPGSNDGSYKDTSYRNDNYKENTDRSERLYYNEVFNDTATQEGIDRLVASTQDLISNEDLLKINNAIEQHLREHGDDLIKPKSKNHESLITSPTMITVQAKISNILKGHDIDSIRADEILQADSNGYKFSTPIVVADTPKNVGTQIFDNVVTTVSPYLENGYQIVGINSEQYNDSEENMVNVTPRPIGSKYLAPLTVALRLLNAENDTYENDHEGADSEFIDTVAKPKQKTIVEMQESIPLDITHINEVEVHEYLDEGRSNSEPYGLAKNLYEKLSSSLQLKDNLNIILNNYNTMNNEEHNQGNSKEQLEVSENIQSPVQIELDNNERSGLYNYNENTNDNFQDGQRIIQPIIIEKHVPVTKFVNRYIEKQVPYPEAVAVPIPVDRPVPYAVPVEKVVEKPVHVTKYVDKPYPVQVPYPVEVQVPYPVHHNIYVDRPVHVAYPVEKIIEKPVVHPVPVPTPFGVPVEVPYPVEQKVLYPFPVDRPVPVPVEVEKQVERVIQKEVPVPYPIERRVPYPVPYETKVPVPYPVEKKVQIPVEKIVDRPVPQIVEKPVHIRVPVPHPIPVHVQVPYPVEKIVEKKVPYPVPIDRIVERKVPIKVPYPVEKIVEKIVEKPVVVTKYVDKPYPVDRLVPYPVEVKVPYQDNDLRVSYRYKQEETKNYPQYQAIDQNDLKNKQLQNLKNQYEQYVREAQKDKNDHRLKSQYHDYVKDYQKDKTKPQLLETTHWGNHYASSYQYLNNSNNNNPNSNVQKQQENYVNHFTNSHSQSQRPSQEQIQNLYASQSQNKYVWDKNKIYQYGQNYNQNVNQSQNKNYHYDYHHQYVDQNQNKNYRYGQNDQYVSQNQNKNNQYGQSDQHISQSQNKNHQYGQNNQHIGQSQNKNYQYGQNDQYTSQSQYSNNWDKNKNYLVEVKVRRTDRVPKVTIEYGFKPPLIPSTEVDLDGLPINKSE